METQPSIVDEWWKKAKARTLPELVAAKKIAFEKEKEESINFLRELKEVGQMPEYDFKSSVHRLEVKKEKFNWDGFVKTVNLSRKTISDIESGNVSMNDDMVHDIATTLECPKAEVYNVLSKNKEVKPAMEETAEEETEIPVTPVKKPRGRPVGSKNKPKDGYEQPEEKPVNKPKTTISKETMSGRSKEEFEKRLGGADQTVSVGGACLRVRTALEALKQERVEFASKLAASAEREAKHFDRVKDAVEELYHAYNETIEE